MRSFNENWDGIARKHDLTEASQQVIGKYRFTPFTEGSITGWTISIQGVGEVGYIQSPAKKNTATTFSPYKVYRTLKASSPNELVMSALPGTETRIVSDKEIRFAPRQLLKGIAMWMDKHGKVMTESMEEVSEAELTTVGYALVVDNKIIYRGSKQQCLKKAKEHGGLKMGKVFITLTPKNIGQSWQKEEVEMESYGNPFTPRVPGTFAAPNFRGEIKAGDKVKVPHKGKMVKGKIVRFDNGGTSKAQQHGGGYVVDVGEPASILVPKEKVQKEDVELDEVITIPSLRRGGVPPLKHFTDLDEFARNVKKATEGEMKTGDMKSYIQQMAGSLFLASRQQQEFFRGLIGMLDDLHRDVGNPSKTGNMEIMRRLGTIIQELKKYQK